MNPLLCCGTRRLRYLVGCAILLLLGPGWIRAQQPLAPDFLLPRSIQSGALTPDQPRAEALFEVDATVTRINLDVRTTAAGLTVTLEAPGGQTVTPQSVAGAGGEYSYFYIDRDVSLFGLMTFWSQGHHYVFKLPSLGEGVYTVRVSSPAAVTEPVGLIFEFGADSTRVRSDANVNTRLYLDEFGLTALLDQPNRVVVSALDGTRPVTGAVVRVEVGPDGGPMQSIDLRDDGQDADIRAGDGLYRAGSRRAREVNTAPSPKWSFPTGIRSVPPPSLFRARCRGGPASSRCPSRSSARGRG